MADTNVVVSAFLWGGTPRKVLDAARGGTIVLFTSPALIAELEEVLGREQFARRIAQAGSSVAGMTGDYLALAHLVRPTARPLVARDPDDDHVLACALAAHADLIVSGDRDLLDLKRYQDIEIVSAAAALERITLDT
ncbi:MAG: putative toxin-antitoxin system toxin component, PIN family [Burkholderiales bacterium]|nr:putative toxin-antitoxin system toxin component, PIN family [Burkholderiales bacterium]